MKDEMIDALVNELLPELLPEVVTDISELIGYSNALKLVKALGGIDFAMPTGDTTGRYQDMLITAVGDDAANKLMKRYGGERLYIPNCHSAFTQLRNQEFRNEVTKAVANGELQIAAIHRLGPMYGFCERWAYTVLSKENKRHDKQLSLFN